MPQLFQLRQEHLDAFETGSAGACAECARPEWAPEPAETPLEPGTYQLQLHEFISHAAHREVFAGTPVAPAHWRSIGAPAIVYIFRRSGGRTQLQAQLNAPFAPFTVAVGPGEGASDFFLFLSRFPLPEARLQEYLGQDGAALLARRALRFSPTAKGVLPDVPNRFHVVLTDYRRLATELEALHQRSLDSYHEAQADPERAQKILLAELTLQTALAFEKNDPEVWSWLQRPPRAGTTPDSSAAWAPQRSKRMVGRPYTAPEAFLAREAQHLERLRLPTETFAEAKFQWMRSLAYEEMRRDSLTDRALQRQTVIDEAELLDQALLSAAGREYLREQVAAATSWHMRYLHRPLPHERVADSNDTALADAYWIILGEMGMAAAAEPERVALDEDALDPDRDAAKYVEIGKPAVGGADARARARDGNAVDNVDDAMDGVSASEKAAGSTTAESRVAEQVRSGRSRVARRFIITSTRVHLRIALNEAGYDLSRGIFISVEKRVTSVTIRTSVQQAENEAAAAHLRTSEAAKDVEQKSIILFDAEKAREHHGRRAWMTTRAVQAIAAVNLVMAGAELREDASGETALKTGGAIADLIYSTEYGLLRAAERSLRGRGLPAGTAASKTVNALPRIVAVRAAAIVGGSISIWLSANDVKQALEKGDEDQAWGAGAVVLGSGLSLAAPLGSILSLFITDGAFLAVLGSPLVAGAAIVFLLLGAAALYYFANPPLEDWLKESEWGVAPGGKPVAEQMEALLQLLCAPEVEVREFDSLSEKLSPLVDGRYGICVTLRPAVLFAEQSTFRVDMCMERCETARSTGQRILEKSRTPYPAASRIMNVAPIPSLALAHSRTLEVPLGARTRQADMSVTHSPAEFTIDSRSRRPAIHYYLPLQRRLEGDSQVRYEWHAEVAVCITTSEYGGFPATALKPFTLSRTPLTRLPP